MKGKECNPGMKRYIHVGCGGWGNIWLNRIIPQIKDVAQCVAAVDINTDALENAGAVLGLPEEALYTELAKALQENEVDFVTISTSIPSHLEVVKTVLEYGRGCHIVSEKPIAGTMAESAELYKRVKAAGIKFAVTFSHRYEDDKQTFQRILRSGMSGKMNYLISRIVIARNHGNSGHRIDPIEMLFIDGGAHNLDMIRAFSGSNAEEVYANAWNIDWDDNRGSAASAFVQVRMENGVRAFLEYQFGGAYTYNGWTHEYFRAECDQASYELDNRRIMARCQDGFPVPEGCEIPLLQGEHWKHDLIIRQFIDWLDGGEAPEVTIDDSIHAMGMLFAAVESSRTGKPVNVKQLMREHGIMEENI